MISWIQRNFQHHFRAIFGVLLAVIIISFIFTIGSTPGIGRGDHRVVAQPFFGYNLGSPDDQRRIYGDAELSVFLQYGIPIGASPQLQQFAFQRTATLALADQLHIPAPSEDTLASYVKTLGGFADANGEFDPSRYETFREKQLWAQLDPLFTADDVSRVISDNWRVDQVHKVLTGPGYVLPGDIKTQLARDDTQWTLSVASADYAKYAPTITPTPVELTKFFSENSAGYKIPDRIRVNYIAFPATDFVQQVNVTEAEVRAYYDANPARFPKPAANKAPVALAKPAPADNFAAVRPQVEDALKLERAQHLAAQAASDVALELYNQKIAGFTPQLDSFLAGRHLAFKPLAPFAADQPPAELGASPEIADEAFKLGPDRFFSDALTTPAGSVILLWKETIPAYTPPLADVQARVTADYKEMMKHKLFIGEFGKAIHDHLVARLKAGDPFDKAVTAANVVAAIAATPATGVKLEVKKIPPFTLRQPPKDLEKNIRDNLDHLEVGSVSDMIFSEGKGWFIYVVAKKRPDLAETGPQFASARATLASAATRATLGSSLDEIIKNELKKSVPADTP